MQGAVPPDLRVRTLRQSAERCEADGDVPRAVEALEEALRVEGVDPSLAREARGALYECLRQAGPAARLAELLRADLDDPEIDADAKVILARELGQLMASGGEPARALGVLTVAMSQRPDDVALVEQALGVARQANDPAQQVKLLTRLIDLTSDLLGKRALLEDLAVRLEQHGDEVTATKRWEELLRLDPSHAGAFTALERFAEKRSDHSRLVELLARRAMAAATPEQERAARPRPGSAPGRRQRCSCRDRSGVIGRGRGS
jgi:tetratricopeptide (TPR) repeat protein